MLSLAVSSLLCIAVATLSVVAAMACLRKWRLFQDPCENAIVSFIAFFLFINILFGVLSVIPIERPLRSLLIPTHMLLLCGVLFTVGRRECAAALTSSSEALAATIRPMPWSIKILGLLLLGLLLLDGVVGGLTVPFDVDEQAYHAPQAIGIFQEGRIRSFQSSVPWLLHYPQGAAHLWAWTMFFTGDTILFRAGQLAFGGQLLLATWLLATRSGASSIGAMLAISILAGMPLFYIIVTTCNADIGFTAAIVTMIAFLAPAPAVGDTDDKRRTQLDLLGASLALSEACLIKVPFVAGFFAVVGIGGFVWARLARGNRIGFWLLTFKSSAAWIAVGLLILSCYTYALNWISTGNPIFPIGITVGQHVIFKGDADQSIEGFGPGINPFPEGTSFAVRWTDVFADWFSPISVDSIGSTGPAYITIVLFWALLAIIDGFLCRNRWTATLAVLAISMFIIPKTWLPRYGLSWLVVLAVLASLSLSRALQSVKSIPLAVSIVICLSGVLQLGGMRDRYLWIKANAAPLAWWRDRGRSVPERNDADRDLRPTAAMVRAIRNRVGAGELLEWCVSSYPYLLWNRTLSNQIEYLTTCGVDPTLAKTDGLASPLYRTVQRTNPYWLLLYSSSELARQLTSYPELNYLPVYKDADKHHPDDQFNMTLFENVTKQQHTQFGSDQEHAN